MPEDAFRHALRFKHKQHRELKQFLQEIGATETNDNGEAFILMYQFDDHLEHNLASAYIFDNEKRQRSNYNLNPSSKRLTNPALISREELIKRSWFTGNYSFLTKRYYNPSAEEPPQQQEKEKEEIKAVSPPEKESPKQNLPIAPIEKTTPNAPSPQVEKINFLVLKKKELNRNKFLKNL